MQGVFYLSKNIKYIDFQLFSDISVNNINYIFLDCSNLLYLNLRSFISTNSNNLNYHEAFSSHPSNIKYCIEDLFTKNIIILIKQMIALILAFNKI